MSGLAAALKYWLTGFSRLGDLHTTLSCTKLLPGPPLAAGWQAPHLAEAVEHAADGRGVEEQDEGADQLVQRAGVDGAAGAPR